MATSLQIQQITSALKRANQRIAQLAKTYGRNSSVYKQEAGKFLKGAYSPYMGVSKSGNIKFDIRAINKLIRTQGVNSSQVTRMLAEIAGIKFDAEGNMKEIKGAGVPTVSELDKRTEKKLERWGEDPGEVPKKELRKITEELAQFSENFQTSYNTYFARHTEAEAREDPIISQLYGENRNHRLSYRQLENIKEEMERQIAEATNDAIKFEEENSGEL